MHYNISREILTKAFEVLLKCFSKSETGDGTAAKTEEKKEKQPGCWEKWTQPFYKDGFCRENKKSTGMHTKENCYSVKRCSDPRIRQACTNMILHLHFST